ncbi:PREDICTED: 28S ribosomal protein S31, mitochondrial-like [Colobus angolensis palliatus]|uniref:28S ribosomal protein S31, mitochondrial-like n=1 Tax=Colobus angolensis palliatus TaxID=336983 RepID=UPI0005F3CBD0|nr:PREDICTED: 28S ribosomal protein S31, mitochondrial-like [Colobus angolensis palliatus]
MPVSHGPTSPNPCIYGLLSEPLSPELVAAASAVADSLPFDKETTKSELLRQLQQHEEESRAQRDAERPKVSFNNIMSDMNVARSATDRVHSRPEHQIQFEEGYDNYPGQKTADITKRCYITDLYKKVGKGGQQLTPEVQEVIVTLEDYLNY